MTEDPKFCSNCGKELTDVHAKYCSSCGTAIQSNPQSNPNPTTNYQSPVSVQVPYKSPGNAMLIAVIAGICGLSGIGHIYVGKLGRGITLLILGLIFVVLAIFFNLGAFAIMRHNDSGATWGVAMIMGWTFGLAYVAIFFWQIFDVRSLARDYNRFVKEQGEEPW